MMLERANRQWREANDIHARQKFLLQKKELEKKRAAQFQENQNPNVEEQKQ